MPVFDIVADWQAGLAKQSTLHRLGLDVSPLDDSRMPLTRAPKHHKIDKRKSSDALPFHAGTTGDEIQIEAEYSAQMCTRMTPSQCAHAYYSCVSLSESAS